MKKPKHKFRHLFREEQIKKETVWEISGDTLIMNIKIPCDMEYPQVAAKTRRAAQRKFAELFLARLQRMTLAEVLKEIVDDNDCSRICMFNDCDQEVDSDNEKFCEGCRGCLKDCKTGKCDCAEDPDLQTKETS